MLLVERLDLFLDPLPSPVRALDRGLVTGERRDQPVRSLSASSTVACASGVAWVAVRS